MAEEPRISFALSEAQREKFKMACLLLGVSMSEVLRGAVDAKIARAEQLNQYGKQREWRDRGGPVRVTFDVGKEE